MAKTLADGKIQVEKGDTLSGIYGKDWKNLSGYTGDPTKLQIGTVLPGIKKTEAPAPVVPASTTPPASLNDANSQINAGQQNDFENASKKDEPATRTSVDKYNEVFKGLSESINSSLPEKPATISMADTYKNLRTEYGVVDLEKNLTDLQTQARDLQAASKARTAAEKAKPVAMNVIAGRISEEEAQDNARLAEINSSIQSVTSQLQTKYGIIDTVMKYTGDDYDNAVKKYDTQLSQNLQVINMVKGIVDQEASEEEKKIDNARANAQIVLNSYTDAGTTYDQISQADKTTLTKLGVQSGLGADFFSNVLKVSSGKNILTTITSADDTKATIVYKDGTTKTISTGLPPKKTTGNTLSKTEIKQQQLEESRSQIKADVAHETGNDRKVNPESMMKIRQEIALNDPENLSWFDNAYEPKNLLNEEYYPTAVMKNQWLTY